MVTQQEIAEFSGETVRNVAGTLIWLARPPEQSKALGWNGLADLLANEDIDKDKVQGAIERLTAGFHNRHDAIVNVCIAFEERLQKAVEDFPLGSEMDPDDIAVPELEKSEEYFRKEREELRDIRDALQRTGGTEAYGAEVFAALGGLDELFEYLVASFQELRWTIMIHDGALAPSTGGTCASGAEFMASIIFEVTEDEGDGGYSASALRYGIHTEGGTPEELRRNVKEAVGCYFDATMKRPELIRLHFVRDEVLVL